MHEAGRLHIALPPAVPYSTRRQELGYTVIDWDGKRPLAVLAADFVDYSGQRKVLEIHRGLLQPGARVLLVDEWIETGAQIQAAIHLIEQEGGVVAGIATINIDDNPLPARLCQKYSCHALWLDMH
jgi:adenine phosphoribosyltransferase